MTFDTLTKEEIWEKLRFASISLEKMTALNRRKTAIIKEFLDEDLPPSEIDGDRYCPACSAWIELGQQHSPGCLRVRADALLKEEE